MKSRRFFLGGLTKLKEPVARTQVVAGARFFAAGIGRVPYSKRTCGGRRIRIDSVWLPGCRPNWMPRS
jgi:hypothetical protein